MHGLYRKIGYRPINGLLFTGYYLSVARVTSVIRVVMVSVLSGYAG